MMTGREVADIGQCCPTSFTTGALTNFLRRETGRMSAEEVSRRYVYLTAGACGACRFGQYHHSYELALRNIGMESLRIFLLEQGKFDQGPMHGGGLDINLQFMLGVFWGLILTDLILDMEYQIRPYEVNPGETDRVSREAVEYLYEVFRKRPVRKNKWGMLAWHLYTGYFANAMREIQERFDKIEVDRLRVKPMVKITGEFYMQTVEGEPNYNIHRWLEAEGAEVYPASISIWLDYLWRLDEQDALDHIGIAPGSRRKLLSVRINQWILRGTYSRMRHAMGSFPRQMIDQYELRKLATPYFHSHMNGGEGDMLIGKALWTYHNKKAHMICELSPYSCMPNTMSIGAMAAVIGHYPDLLYAPLEIKGDSEVHALSRCQMILTEAKKRAQREYEDALARTGFTEAALRESVAMRPELKRATYRIPHYGAAGTAANLVLHLASTKNT
jgi:predicted nucleotide-binding protein (sugar kinase/HSP70/actin superfamily)